MLNTTEIAMIYGAQSLVLKLSPTQMNILVTHSSHFVGAGTYGGNRLNMILHPHQIHDLNNDLLPYDLTQPIYHNGHKIIAAPIEGGHIYQIWFNQG
jgi:hypothetical protein